MGDRGNRRFLFQKPLWANTSNAELNYGALGGETSADIVVVGAGVAGLSTAFHLAKLGKSVAIVEAEYVGSGASGVSGGLLAPDFIRHNPSEIEQEFGRKWGNRLVNLIGTAPQQCFDLIKEQGISCDAVQDGFWTPAHNQETETLLKNRAKEWKQRGFQAEYFSSQEVMSELGSPKYSGAIKFADGGSLNPLLLCRGLSLRAADAGVRIYCHSSVSKIEFKDNKYRIQAKGGCIDADKVILCANGGNQLLHPALRKTTLPLKVIEYATKSLPDILRSKILPNGGAFTDKQPYLFTARYDPTGRLIAALPDFSFPRSKKLLLREAAERILRHFPLIKNISIDYIWRGTAWLNVSLLPKIYQVEDGIFAIQACNGRGLANNIVLGKELAAALANNDMDLLSVKAEEPKPIKGYFFAQFVPSLLMAKAYVMSKIS